MLLPRPDSLPAAGVLCCQRSSEGTAGGDDGDIREVVGPGRRALEHAGLTFGDGAVDFGLQLWGQPLDADV